MAARSSVLGPYELVSPLAEGGMAEIFVARTRGIGGFEKDVALKVIHPNFSSDPAFVQMLVEEAKISVLLQHANIVQTYDLGAVDDEYYIAMELIDGVDLFKLLRKASDKNIEFPFDVAAFVAAQVSLGLDYAHRRGDERGRPLGIIHRDVSPQNVLLSRDGEVKIVDFGIAKAALREHQTEAGVIKGKYYYMSPEQALGQPLDPRTDVFSTGILLYEMLVGQMLYLDDDMERLLDKVRKARVPPPSGRRPKVPISLERLVMKALRRNREDRFATSSEMAIELQKYLKTAAPAFGREQLAAFVALVLGEARTSQHKKAPPGPADLPPDEHSLIHQLPVREPSEDSPFLAPSGEGEGREDSPFLAPSGEGEGREDSSADLMRSRDANTNSRIETTSPEKRNKLRTADQPGFGVSRAPEVEGPAKARPSRSAPRTLNEETRPASLPMREPPKPTAPVARPVPAVSPPPRAAMPSIAAANASSVGSDYGDDEYTIVDSGGETLLGERALTGDDAPSVPPRARRDSAAPASALRLPTAGATPLRRGENAPIDPGEPGDTEDASDPANGDDGESTAIDRLARPKAAMRARTSGENTSPVELGYRPTEAAPIVKRGARPTTPLTQALDEVTNESRMPPSKFSDPDETRPMVDGPQVYAAPQKNTSPPSGTPLTAPPHVGSAYGGGVDRVPTGSAAIDLRGGRNTFAWIFGAAALLSSIVVSVVLLLQNEPPAVGTVQVVSAPPGAEVRLDGMAAADKTPLVLHNVDARRNHALIVTLPGFEPWETTVSFVQNAREVRLQAILAPLVGRLEVTSLPAGAEVIVNGQVRGTTPATIDALPRNEDLVVELRLRGYRAVRRTVAWGTQRAVALTVPLEKAN